MSQTSVSLAGQSIAVAGQISDNSPLDGIVSRFSQETSASAVIPFGTAVKPGAARDGVRILTAIAEKVEGLVVWSANHQPGSNGDLDQTLGGLKPNASIQLMRQGRMYAVIDPSVSSITPYTDRGFVRAIANGGDSVIGALRTNADGSDTIDCTEQIQFVSGIFLSADGVTKLAEVDVNFIAKP